MQHDVVVSIEPDRIIQVHTSQGIALMNATSVRTTYKGRAIMHISCDIRRSGI